MSKENIKEEDNTYSGEGMLYGVVAGSIIGAIVIAISNVTYYLPLCVSTGMIIGLAIGTSIKKDKKKIKKWGVIMNDRDLEKILKEYFTRISAPESTTKVIENALRNMKE